MWYWDKDNPRLIGAELQIIGGAPVKMTEEDIISTGLPRSEELMPPKCGAQERVEVVDSTLPLPAGAVVKTKNL